MSTDLITAGGDLAELLAAENAALAALDLPRAVGMLPDKRRVAENFVAAQGTPIAPAQRDAAARMAHRLQALAEENKSASHARHGGAIPRDRNDRACRGAASALWRRIELWQWCTAGSVRVCRSGLELPAACPPCYCAWMDTLAPETWRRLLRRLPADAEVSSLYGPLLQSPTAADGCFVLGRIAQSLDGRIAIASGASQWISGREDIVHTHRLRALFDAVVVGARTVRADDPQLTTREVEGPSPVRVVLDTDRRLDARYRVFRDDPRTLLLCASDAGGEDRVGAGVGTAPAARA